MQESNNHEHEEDQDESPFIDERYGFTCAIATMAKNAMDAGVWMSYEPDFITTVFEEDTLHTVSVLYQDDTYAICEIRLHGQEGLEDDLIQTALLVADFKTLMTLEETTEMLEGGKLW